MLIKQLNDSEVPASYTVTATFTSTNTNYSGSSNTKQLTVVPRSASYLGTGFYTGDVFVWTPTATSSTGTVVLAATIKDNNDLTGDVRGAKVTFYYVNGSTYTPIPGATNLPVGLVDMTDGTVGTASAVIQLNIGNQNATSYEIAVGITGAYINRRSAPEAYALVTVSKPVPGGYITGGGSLPNTASSGMIKGAAGKETSFSVDVQFNSKLTNPQGKTTVTFFSYYKSDGTLDAVEHKYKIASNAISTFVVGKNGAQTREQATFSSKANLVEELENGTIVAIEGGAILQLSMGDYSFDGKNDNFGITLQRKAGGIWFSSNWNGTKTIDQVLSGGNVYVSTSGVTSRTSEPEITTAPETQAVAEELVAEAQIFNVMAYPNPSTEYFTLRLQGATQDQVQVNVFDVNGRQVYTKIGNYNDNYQFGERFQAGIYLVNVQQGTNKVSLKVIKQ
jgi:hypothetical protein